MSDLILYVLQEKHT